MTHQHSPAFEILHRISSQSEFQFLAPYFLFFRMVEASVAHFAAVQMFMDTDG